MEQDKHEPKYHELDIFECLAEIEKTEEENEIRTVN